MGLEFTGGTLLQVGFKQLPPVDEVRNNLTKEGWKSLSLQTQPSSQSLIIKVKGERECSKDDIAYDVSWKALKKYYPDNVKPVVDRVEFIGPVVGRQLIVDTYKTIFLSLAVICVYVAFRFKNWIWGVSGAYRRWDTTCF